jgi:S-adenosylmethionine decarboxylase
MKNIAPDIIRQRLLIEGYYNIDISEDAIKEYLHGIARHLDLRTYGEPVIYSPSPEMGKEENLGFDAFIPLIDSGISLYIWSRAGFFSIILYTCKSFNEISAVDYTKEFFKCDDKIVHLSF